MAITEKITTPTIEELLNIFSAGQRAMERAEDWEDMMDWRPLERVRDYLMVEGKKFFEKRSEHPRGCRGKYKDPLEMFMTLKKLNPSKVRGDIPPVLFGGSGLYS